MKKLKTLEEYNNEKSMINNGVFNEFKNSSLNGIECPNCKEELYDLNDGNILLSHPPKKAIKCKNCKFTGYRLA